MSESFQNIVSDKEINDNQKPIKLSLVAKLIRAFTKRSVTLARFVPAEALLPLLTDTLLKSTSSLSAMDRLAVLLRLDNVLYEMQSAAAITYDKGQHPKHRLTKYHAFFVARIDKGERVLDIGCGSGAVAYSIVSECRATVVGIDIQPENIKIAQEKYKHPNLSFRVGDALLLENEKFDVVVLSNVLEHLPHRDQFLKRTQEVTQAKRYLIRVPVYERDWRVPLKAELGIDWRLDPTHETEFTNVQFYEETGAAGLEVVHFESRWGEIWAELKVKGG
jgi:2-polyprenyl-3-methyl-5-hydroxy-6-metoxy-1,4-benzoquinol methylase